MISQTSATVGGSVDPNGQSTSYRLEYGTTTSSGSRDSAGNLGVKRARLTLLPLRR